MPDETKRLVKLVCCRSLQIARKCHLVASRLATPIKRKLHHLFSDTFALMFDDDHHIFDQARRSAPMRQIVNDQQREGPDHFLVNTSNVEFVVWIPPKSLPSFPRLLDTENIAVVYLGLSVQRQNFWKIILNRLTYDNRVHEFGERSSSATAADGNLPPARTA